MNSLSWLLYAADVADNIKTTGGMVAVFSTIGGLAAFGLSFILAEPFSFDSEETKAEKRGVGKAIRATSKTFIIIGVSLITIGTLLPSRETMMLIAASEVGETVLASDQAQKIGGEAGALATDSLKVLRKFINDQLGEAAE